MSSLKKDIKESSDALVEALMHEHVYLDKSFESLIDIDKFFNKHSKNGKPVRSGQLSQNLGAKMFSIAAYVGNCFVENIKGARWVINDQDPEGKLNITVKFPDGGEIYPCRKVIKRLANGAEDSIYVYAHLIASKYIDFKFNEKYWSITNKKPWWKF